MSSLYDTDLYRWAIAQAEALRAAARLQLDTPQALDWENLAEEIEDLGKARARELSSRYYRLLTHLLKWELQPAKRKSGWAGMISEQRYELATVLDESPSLKRQQQERLVRAYAKARGLAAVETGLPLANFPASCPYTIEQVMDDDFWPGPPSRRIS